MIKAKQLISHASILDVSYQVSNNCVAWCKLSHWKRTSSEMNFKIGLYSTEVLQVHLLQSIPYHQDQQFLLVSYWPFIVCGLGACKLADSLEQVCKEDGMGVNIKKTKLMVFINEGDAQCKTKVSKVLHHTR